MPDSSRISCGRAMGGAAMDRLEVHGPRSPTAGSIAATTSPGPNTGVTARAFADGDDEHVRAPRSDTSRPRPTSSRPGTASRTPPRTSWATDLGDPAAADTRGSSLVRASSAASAFFVRSVRDIAGCIARSRTSPLAAKHGAHGHSTPCRGLIDCETTALRVERQSAPASRRARRLAPAMSVTVSSTDDREMRQRSVNDEYLRRRITEAGLTRRCGG